MIKPYGLLIAIGLLTIYFYCRLNYQKYQLSFPLAEKGLIWAFIFALIGARVYHIFSTFSYYSHSPLKIFLVWEGGLGIFGAILGGIAGVGLYSKLKHLSPLNLLNLTAPPLLLAQAIGRLGNYFNYEGFGPPTNLPWKMFVPIEYRPPQLAANSYFHPTFFYESALCLVMFLIFILLPSKFQKTHGLSYYLISYGLIRFFTEFFRLDTWAVGKIHLATFFSLALITTGMFLFFFHPYNRIQTQ
ncbi:MAG TPA: prolipoprotein diacylglyceryl transferase [Patescibacteria group bacterium]|nr:prolipoprotein diacylglyceryl transferase [Patescibacteria group bacterium]HUW24744.1 prolipoprotein diacylglyceryl transferase [Patescibacteria group bacterium]